MKFWNWRIGNKPQERERRKAASGIATSQRESLSLGLWSDIFGQWQPRQHSPWLYEALREAFGILDGGIHGLTTMDGILRVEGGNDRTVGIIEEWMANIPVNDLETGYQAFYASMGAEHYEQGVGVGEYEMSTNGRDVIRLRTADSKGIVFTRDGDRLRCFYCAPTVKRDMRSDGLDNVQALLRGCVQGDAITTLRNLGYAELDPAQCVFALHRPEAGNPYGTSVLRSLPFVAQLLLKMQNSVGRTWERYGDPMFHVHYSTKNRKITHAEAFVRAQKMAQDLGVALAGKSRGNSVDLSTAAAADDDVKVEVIGAAGIALEIETPARSMLEQIIAAFGLPPWMLGITWSQAAGVGEPQAELVMQQSRTRFELRKPGLERPIAAMLRARGIAWKAGDWKLVQELPSLADVMKRAQAGFLNAQTALMLSNSGQVEPPELGTGIDNNLRAQRGRHSHKSAKAGNSTKADDEDDDEGESWAEDDPELPLIEARTAGGMLSVWHKLSDAVIALLALNAVADEPFVFPPEKIPDMLAAGNAAQADIIRALLPGQMSAWDRGMANAGLQLSVDFGDADVIAAIARARAAVREAFAAEGLALVRGGMAREYQTAIVARFASGVYDGMNPVNVARDLKRQFGAGDYNWRRLAASEIVDKQAMGKLDMLAQQGVAQFYWDTAPDACPICTVIRENGPYHVADPAAPRPMRDSHPHCRCSIRPVA